MVIPARCFASAPEVTDRCTLGGCSVPFFDVVLARQLASSQIVVQNLGGTNDEGMTFGLPTTIHLRIKMNLYKTFATGLAVTSFAAYYTACYAFQDAPVKAVATANAPAAIGPYSQAIKAGNTLYLSGQIALDPRTGQVAGTTIEEQTRQVLLNLRAVLEADGMTMANVVSTTVYLRDLNDFGAMNGVYGTFFTGTPPARATIQAARLPRDVAVEISAIAVK